jgi:hypothetical protein
MTWSAIQAAAGCSRATTCRAHRPVVASLARFLPEKAIAFGRSPHGPSVGPASPSHTPQEEVGPPLPLATENGKPAPTNASPASERVARAALARGSPERPAPHSLSVGPGGRLPGSLAGGSRATTRGAIGPKMAPNQYQSLVARPRRSAIQPERKVGTTTKTNTQTRPVM